MKHDMYSEKHRKINNN